MRLSLRIWQTCLFIFVVLVAMSILYFDLLSALKTGVSSMSKSQLKREALELAHHLATDMRLQSSPSELREHLIEFIKVYEDDIWVYDSKGKLLFLANDRTSPGALLDEAREAGLKGKEFMFYDSDNNRGVVAYPIRESENDSDANTVAAGAARGRENGSKGVVIVSTVAAEAENIHYTVKRELNYAFWIALIASSLLGAIFSEVIAFQVRKLTRGALEIARGKFDLRLKGVLPDEVGELADAFNVMAERLKDAFGAIRAQEREMYAVIANMSEGVVEVDASGKIRLANDAAASLLDTTTDRLSGMLIGDICPDEQVLSAIEGALEGRADSVVFTLDHHIILVHAAPMRLLEGAEPAAVVILSDITEQKRLEQAQKDFIANASHELRTPISSLKGFVELLEGGAKDKTEVRDSFLKTMQSEIDRLQRLVEELFVLAQIDSGRMELKLGSHSVNKMLDDVVAIASPIASSSGISVSKIVDTGLPRVTLDRDKIVQVLLSFVDNAIKNSRPGSSVRITARSANDGKSVEIGVTDEGIGISEDNLSKVFDRFYHKPTSRLQRKGAGLGLSIAKEIIEAHGSRILVKSKSGVGSTFYFTLSS